MRDPRTFCIEQLAEPDREVVLKEFVPLLEAGLSPSQVLDYWAVEDTDETHGAFTQPEWAEIRNVSRQAIGGNVGNARAMCLTRRQSRVLTVG